MLKQGIVQESVAMLSSKKEDLPPIPPHQLQNWTQKSGGGGRGNGPGSNRSGPRGSISESHTPPKRVVKAGNKRISAAEAALEDAAQKMGHLERSIRFLKNQHTEVLQALHAEIDELKRKNKDLHIRLIVRQRAETASALQERSSNVGKQNQSNEENQFLQKAGPQQKKSSIADLRKAGISPTSLESEARIALLEEEVKDLKSQLRESRSRHMNLTNQHENLQRNEEKLLEVISEREQEISKLSDRLNVLESVTFAEEPNNINISVEEISVTNATNTEPIGEQDTERELKDISELPDDAPRTEDTLVLNLQSDRSRRGSSVAQSKRANSMERSGRSNSVEQSGRGNSVERMGSSRGLSPKKPMSRGGNFSQLSNHGDGLTPSALGNHMIQNDTLIQIGNITATILPLQVYPDGINARVPTLQECAVIVRYLKKIGDERAGELRKLKTDLRDLLDSNKWSPDAFLLARAYVSDLTTIDDVTESSEKRNAGQPRQHHKNHGGSTQLPRIELRQRTKRVPSDAYVPVKEEMTLPALSQALPGTKIAERKRRTQILQKARLHPKVPESMGL